MKKYYYVSMFVGLVSLLNLNNVQATPLYYTFEGLASSTHGHGSRVGSFYDLTGLSGNDPISYVIMIDNEVESVIRPDGSVHDYGHTITELQGHEWHYISYHAELVSGTGLVIDKNSLEYNQLNSYFSAYVAFDQQGENDVGDFTFSGNAFNGHFISYCYAGGDVPRKAMDSYADFTQWAVGHLRSGDSWIYINDDSGYQSGFAFYLQLTSISETDPSSSVPEPSTFLLMGIGLIGIGATRNRKLLT
jgi:hypothetical protein